MIKTLIYKRVVLIEDPIKDGVIVTATTTGIFLVLNSLNINQLKASLDDLDAITCK